MVAGTGREVGRTEMEDGSMKTTTAAVWALFFFELAILDAVGYLNVGLPAAHRIVVGAALQVLNIVVVEAVASRVRRTT